MIANLLHFLDGVQTPLTDLTSQKKTDGESKGFSKTCKIMTGVGVTTVLVLIILTLCIVFLVVLKSTVPNAPANLLRNNALTDSTEVAFSWDAPTDDGGKEVIDYAVEQYDEQTENFTVVQSGLNTTSCTISNLSENTSYKFRVRARNTVGLGDPS